MPLNTLVWRVIATTPDGHYIEAVSSLLDRGPPERLRLPRHPDAAHVLADVPLHARLRWFTDDWLRYDVVGASLVVSDLRMGIPGQYTFRFKFAECDAAGTWTAVTPTAWPSPRPGMPELRAIGRRIFAQDPGLPLAEWARCADAVCSGAQHRENSGRRTCSIR